MTTTTRDALHRVADILKEAGWDEPPAAAAPEVGRVGQRLEELRAELGLEPGDFRRAVLAAVAGDQ